MLTESQLLNCLRTNVKRAKLSPDVQEKQSLLDAADIVINELLLRSESSFYLRHYASGRELAANAPAMLQQLGSDPLPVKSVLQQLPDNLSSDMGMPAIEHYIEQLIELLQSVVKLLPTTGHQHTGAYLNNIIHWETKFYSRQMEDAPLPPQTQVTAQTEINAENFEAYVQKKFPQWENFKVTEFAPLHGGFSKKTIMLETQDSVNGKQSLVIRAQQENVMLELYAGQIPDEYQIVTLAYDAGALLSKPLWVEDNKALFGCYFMVSERASGANLGSATGASEPITEPMIKSLAEEIARIHNLDFKNYQQRINNSVLAPWQAAGNIAENTRKQMQFWREKVKENHMDASTIIERGLRWLEDNIEPCSEEPVLLHGDYGLHNVLIENEQVTAILDWEVSHIGDPAEELSWLLSCTENAIDPDLLLKHYRAAGGKDFSEFRLRYFDVLNCLKLPLAGLASIAALNRQPDNIQYAVFALRFIHHGACRIVDAINKAEAVKTQ
jgi:aminoglycoside phosphotransferase (APT) family kinase protein